MVFITIKRVYADVSEHPAPRLAFRCQISSDATPVDTAAQWREDWQSACVVSYTIVADPNIRQPGFDSSVMVSAEPFSHRSKPMLCNPTQMGPCQITDMRLLPAADYEPYEPLTKFDGGLQVYNYFTKLKMMQSSGWNLYRLQHSRTEITIIKSFTKSVTLLHKTSFKSNKISVHVRYFGG